jgi:hypothetical protein
LSEQDAFVQGDLAHPLSCERVRKTAAVGARPGASTT